MRILRFIQPQVMENYMNPFTRKENFILLSRWNHLRNIYYLRNEICKRKIELIHANSLRMVLYAFLLQKFIKKDENCLYETQCNDIRKENANAFSVFHE